MRFSLKEMIASSTLAPVTNMMFQKVNIQRPCRDISQEVLISPSILASQEEWDKYKKELAKRFPEKEEEKIDKELEPVKL